MLLLLQQYLIISLKIENNLNNIKIHVLVFWQRSNRAHKYVSRVCWMIQWDTIRHGILYTHHVYSMCVKWMQVCMCMCVCNLKCMCILILPFCRLNLFCFPSLFGLLSAAFASFVDYFPVARHQHHRRKHRRCTDAIPLYSSIYFCTRIACEYTTWKYIRFSLSLSFLGFVYNSRIEIDHISTQALYYSKRSVALFSMDDVLSLSPSASIPSVLYLSFVQPLAYFRSKF